MTFPIWLMPAWLWLQKNWRWVLFPIGILLLVLGWTRRTSVTVAGSSLLEADQNAKKLADQAVIKTQEAATLRDIKVDEADHALEVDVAVVVDREKAEAPALVQDPDALNQALLAVGKHQRGPS
jgi:hypothetical protein